MFNHVKLQADLGDHASSCHEVLLERFVLVLQVGNFEVEVHKILMEGLIAFNNVEELVGLSVARLSHSIVNGLNFLLDFRIVDEQLFLLAVLTWGCSNQSQIVGAFFHEGGLLLWWTVNFVGLTRTGLHIIGRGRSSFGALTNGFDESANLFFFDELLVLVELVNKNLSSNFVGAFNQLGCPGFGLFIGLALSLLKVFEDPSDQVIQAPVHEFRCFEVPCSTQLPVRIFLAEFVNNKVTNNFLIGLGVGCDLPLLNHVPGRLLHQG